MREVFGERGIPQSTAARAIKPTEVGDAAERRNPDKTTVNKGRKADRHPSPCGEGYGDTLEGLNSHGLQPPERRPVLEKVQTLPEAPGTRSGDSP